MPRRRLRRDRQRNPVQLFTCNGSPGQVWKHQTNGALLNPNSGRCLDVPSANITTGTAIQIYDCDGTQAQQCSLPT